MPPLVSIIIPVYNQRADFLRTAIKSAISQTYKDIEVVVSNNHSTFSTNEVIAEFHDSRIRVVQPPTHLPMVQHFAFAAEQGVGDYLSFLSSDDILEPDCVETLIGPLIKSQNAVFAFGEISGIDFENENAVLYTCRNDQMPSGEYSPEQVIELVIELSRTAGWLVGDIILTDAYRKIGGIQDKKLQYSGDHALAMKLIELGSAIYVNVRVGKHRVWRREDGKIDANRAMRSVDDVSRLYEIMENSSPVLNDPTRFNGKIASAKKRKAILLVLSLINGQSEEYFFSAEFQELRTKILQLDSGLMVRMSLALSNLRLIRIGVRHLWRLRKSLRRKLVN